MTALLLEIFLAPKPAQLKQLGEQHDMDELIAADILRHCDAWGLMLVLRAKPTPLKRKRHRKIGPGRWGTSP